MCGRFANLVQPTARWGDLLSPWPEETFLGCNIAPTARVPAFTRDGGQTMHWGMIPGWAREPRMKYATFNARAESVAEKPVFRHSFRNSQTCLVPALGYYEWKGPKGDRQPYFIRSESGDALVMAGLWEQWGSAQESLLSCTIITQPSSGALSDLHPRMPVMLNPDQAGRWLNHGSQELQSLTAHPDVSGLIFYPVDQRVNRTGNDGLELTRPLES